MIGLNLALVHSAHRDESPPPNPDPLSDVSRAAGTIRAPGPAGILLKAGRPARRGAG